MNGSGTRSASVAPAAVAAVREDVRPARAAAPVIEVDDLRRRFGEVEALRGVSLEVDGGEIHAVLGPNGAGKTTLMRILCGLVDPSEGSAYVLDRRPGGPPTLRESIGLVPSGDRSFYLRLSGLENLVFFARVNGMRRRHARRRAAEVLEAVGLSAAGRRPVNTYSHGMQKRLSFARALLHDPPVLLVDEATHDLDPAAAAQVRALTRERARSGSAVLWATQRIEELAGFADRVTVLDRGVVCFAGTVAALAAEGGGDRHVVGLGPRTTADLPAMAAALGASGHVQPASDAAHVLVTLAPGVSLGAALGASGHVQPASDAAHVLVTLAPGVSLGAALSALTAAGAEVTSCRDERPAIERAFLAVTGGRAA